MDEQASLRRQFGIAKVIEAARDTAPVTGYTHNFYRYPARFSPVFVRAAIAAFTEPGDWILDPFVGGGTTLVEAAAAGRNSIGIDISSLATFVSTAKTTILSESESRRLDSWQQRLPHTINIHSPSPAAAFSADDEYYRHLNSAEHWRLKKAIAQVLASVTRLRGEGAERVARCIVLKTAQWALDARKILPSVARFRAELSTQAEGMLNAQREFQSRLPKKKTPRVICLNRSVAGIEQERDLLNLPRPRLVLTSPPYPGIHVLYHRWQVDGRKEAPAPFWIANCLDGSGASYYTMGDRHYPRLKTYFDNLRANFTSIAKLCGPETIVLQMVAFSEPSWQLREYLRVMEDCGLEEVRPWNRSGGMRRLWRDVPNRKWYANQSEHAPGSREVVLAHRLSD